MHIHIKDLRGDKYTEKECSEEIELDNLERLLSKLEALVHNFFNIISVYTRIV